MKEAGSHTEKGKGPFRVAVVGIGGFAGAHHAALRGLEQAGLVKVRAACDPLAGELQERRERYQFAERGVEVYPDLAPLLAAHGKDLDLIDVSSPIRCHAGHHRACVQRGIACYLEKPPTLDPEELEGMIRTEARARFATQVGFNHIGQAWRQRLKERVLSGEFGRLRRVAFKGLWRRSEAYYRRNNWAGRLQLGDFILLDSCCGNAMAHHVHNTLFHAGTDGVMSWASPAWVEAELYRANRIEGADTVFARGMLDNEVEFSLAATHACVPDFSHAEVLECEEARIEIGGQGEGAILRRDGGRERFETGTESSAVLVQSNLESYCGYLAGQYSRPATRLEDSRPFVHLNALLYIASGGIGTVAAPYARAFRASGEEQDTWRIEGIEDACERFFRSGPFPSEAGLAWARPGGRAAIGRIPELRGVLEGIEASGASGWIR
jgi:predicted dehydrogenase